MIKKGHARARWPSLIRVTPLFDRSFVGAFARNAVWQWRMGCRNVSGLQIMITERILRMSRPADMFLTPQELQRLTGYARASAQIRWLRKNGWRFTVNGLKEPIVAVAESERKLVSGVGTTRQHEPNFGALNG
jgi:hypothetical protein